MKELPADKGLKIFDINYNATTAGPSPYPNNERVEVFLLGCNKAASGRPCPGCFNSIIWDSSKATHSWDPIEVADAIAERTPNRYITIGGGEPLDQYEYLIPFIQRLKELGFHILMYTWRELLQIRTNFYYFQKPHNVRYIPMDKLTELYEIYKYVDIIIDGDYRQEEKLYKENTNDGFFGSIGSGNQIIWDMQDNKLKKPKIENIRHEYMRDLKGIRLDENNKLIYIYKD